MKRVFVFEGPDGTGKTTLAMALSRRIGATYIHHGSYPQAGDDLLAIYTVSMIPAVSMVVDVVMDRSWLSEKIYGHVYRNGADRIGDARRHTFEVSLMAQVKILVIQCDADFSSIEANWLKRRGVEYLDDVSQLRDVWSRYHNDFNTALPVMAAWPLIAKQHDLIERILEWQ
jgi:DNA polymerase III delta prime subunit